MIFLHSPPNLEETAVLYHMISILFQVYSVINIPEHALYIFKCMYNITIKTAIVKD